jgi:choline dehydrogenase-like flavoprotein
MQKHYDLVIAGTGFASTFFLKKYLSKMPKAKVLVLERGHLFPHRERIKEERGEKTSYSKLNPEPHHVYFNKSSDKHWAFTIGFGGSSNCWYGCTPRFLPSDFKMKTLYGATLSAVRLQNENIVRCS